MRTLNATHPASSLAHVLADGWMKGWHSLMQTAARFMKKPSGATIFKSGIVLARSALDSTAQNSHCSMRSRVSCVQS